METVVFEDSPLGEYLDGNNDEEHNHTPEHAERGSLARPDSSPMNSPSFAPRGRPRIQTKFRDKLPPPLRLNTPRNNTVRAIHNTWSKALNSRLGRADNSKFLERFRYLIVASNLLREHLFRSQSPHGQSPRIEGQGDHMVTEPDLGPFTLAGAGFSTVLSLAVAYSIYWIRADGNVGAWRLAIVLLLTVVLATFGYTYMRRQWLQYLRQQALDEAERFISSAQKLDGAAGAALTLIQEVELVSHGYRISTPMAPISRMDRYQTRRCIRLRKALHTRMMQLLPRYNEACTTLKPLAELVDLEKYFDVYDIGHLDLQEASLGYEENEFEDPESLRVLKILVSRYHIIRKVLLCCLLALDADGGKPDFHRWSTTVDEIQALGSVNADAEHHLVRILDEEESFPVPPTPKLPLTPGREQWRGQMRKFNAFSSGIRGLGAKMHVLRDESNKTLDESEDLSELGPKLLTQYKAIGADLKILTEEWEVGMAALANNLEKNEKRISSMSLMSGMLSPAISLGGLTSVEESSPTQALRILNGDDVFKRTSLDMSSSEAEEYEAIAVPRQRSLLSREERIAKMKENRVIKEEIRGKSEANTRMLRELESVINLRPKGKTGRVTSL